MKSRRKTPPPCINGGKCDYVSGGYLKSGHYKHYCAHYKKLTFRDQYSMPTRCVDCKHDWGAGKEQGNG
jgi:hypothetical protein